MCIIPCNMGSNLVVQKLSRTAAPIRGRRHFFACEEGGLSDYGWRHDNIYLENLYLQCSNGFLTSYFRFSFFTTAVFTN